MYSSHVFITLRRALFRRVVFYLVKSYRVYFINSSHRGGAFSNSGLRPSSVKINLKYVVMKTRILFSMIIPIEESLKIQQRI